MEGYAANDMTWYILLDEMYRDMLGSVRHWRHIKMASADGHIWLSGITADELNTAEVRCIPGLRVYYERQGKLFPEHSQLPERTAPSLLWTPIARALPVSRPAYNHNYFGTDEQVQIRIIPSDGEQESVAMIADMDVLEQYITGAPAVRLKPITWVILNNDKALLFGTPLLPLNGQALWCRGNMLLPAGYDMELYTLANIAGNVIDREQGSWIVWHADSTYFLVDKTDMRPLLLSSFRLSRQQMAL